MADRKNGKILATAGRVRYPEEPDTIEPAPSLSRTTGSLFAMSETTAQIQHWIERLQTGDRAARNELLKCACDRLERLTRKMLKDYPSVSPWE